MPGSCDHPRLRATPLIALSLLLTLACAGGGASAAHSPEPAQSSGKTLMGYDAEGQASACEAPREECADAERNPDFIDRCRLAGYRVLRCGCDERCAGNVKKQEAFFDAVGKQRSCEPEQAGCTPPETSAKFQDACTDARHKLVVCGCEWLCNGPLASGQAATPE